MVRARWALYRSESAVDLLRSIKSIFLICCFEFTGSRRRENGKSRNNEWRSYKESYQYHFEKLSDLKRLRRQERELRVLFLTAQNRTHCECSTVLVKVDVLCFSYGLTHKRIKLIHFKLPWITSYHHCNWWNKYATLKGKKWTHTMHYVEYAYIKF